MIWVSWLMVKPVVELVSIKRGGEGRRALLDNSTNPFFYFLIFPYPKIKGIDNNFLNN